MKLQKVLFYGGIAVMFSACSHHPMDAKVEFAPPKYVEQMPEKDVSLQPMATGSLYSPGSTSLFGDRMAMHVNDIVTILIQHKTQSSSSDSKKLSRENNSQLGGGTLTAPNLISGGFGGPMMIANSLAGAAFEAGSNSTFQGQGQAQKQDTFTTTVTARVIKIMPNDTYFIDGNREIMLNGEKQTLRIAGVIRRQDIGQDNIINADRMSDAKIAFSTEGDIARNTTVPWGTKFLEAVWPF